MRRWLRQLPNLVSSIRILLAVPMALTLAHHQFIATLWLFGAAAVSDAVDGFLAKRFDWQTELGGILDPVADKLMLATVFVMLAVLGYVPIWLTAAVIGRDCIIVLGAISYRVWIGPVKARPSLISKLNTLCQVIFILAVIGALRFSWPSPWVALPLGALVFVTVVVSGMDYVLVYGRQAIVQARARHAQAHPGAAPPAISRTDGSTTPPSGGDRPQDDPIGAARKAPSNPA
jgi:cardiolipin synthase (CMP-forming)